MGILAICFWASTVGVSRIAMESIGIFSCVGLIHLASGVIACGYLLARGRLGPILMLPRKFLLGCGTLFVLYVCCLYGSIGLASGREQTIVIGLANYTWPTLVLVLSVPLQRFRWRWTLIPGALLAPCGIVLAAMNVRGISLMALLDQVEANGAAFALALTGALIWGLYSNLSRVWGGPNAPSPVPLFILVAGLVLGAVSLLGPERNVWSPPVVAVVIYLGIFPVIMASVFWDIAVRRGSFVVVGAVAYLTPLLSTLIGCLVLKPERMGLLLWLGVALTIAGALICRVSLRERRAMRPEDAGQ